MFGNFWTNVVLVVNFWSFRDVHAQERRDRGVTVESYSKQLKDVFENKFDLDFDLPVVFIDTHYNKVSTHLFGLTKVPYINFSH